jgi:NADH-quinone oxidoreductase subunit D
LINNEGFCLAVEKFFGVDVPERCKYIRTMLSELSRISDHQTCIGAAAMELGAFTPFLYLMKGRELIYRILEEVTGHRLTINYMRPGGLAADLPEGFFEHLRDILPVIREVTSETDKLLTKNRIFIDRTRNVGAISKEDALSFSYSGPCLRACGMAYDVRKAFPYSAYDHVDFEVPVGSTGDTLDRYLVRMGEMEQSVRIIEQCMRQIPDGPVSVNDPRVILPPKQEVYHTIEGLVNHFKLVYEGIRPPKGEVYQMVEGGNGELGYYIVSDGTGRPYRVRVRPPCFTIVSSMDFMIKGAMMADIVPVFGSLNMIAGEMER